jgi:D-glycero-D-manno-heptose 1,7-bisphosphate phosphatase
LKTPSAGLVLIDRDGVLNELVVDPEQGTVDSPMVPAQVRMVPRAAEAVAALTKAGWGVAIVSNQPSAAKGKTTRQNLEAVHQTVLDEIARAGGKILSSHLCFHRAEDQCACRKPRTGLMEDAFKKNLGYPRDVSWMIGDGLMDVQAGQSFGLHTAFLAAHKCDTCQTALRRELRPTLWADDLWNAAAKIVHWAAKA